MGDSSEKVPPVDLEEAKFLPNGAKDPEKGNDVDGGGGDFVGLSKEELQEFADDPFWVRTRKIMFVLFWVLWFGMVAAAIIIIVLSPKCPARPDQKWWETSAVYRVDVRTFADKDGDGIGDIGGLVEKLDYINKLGVGAICLRSIFRTGGEDALRRDVVDFKNTDGSIGNEEDFKNLVKSAHKKGIKIILEMDPNHSSKKHFAFVDSQKKTPAFANYYVWQPTKPAENAWKTLDNQEAWTEDPVRKEFYYHVNGPELPDFNLKSEAVQAHLLAAIKYWLVDEQIDGFLLNRPELLVESDNLANNPDGWIHQPGSVDFVAKVRSLLGEVADETGKSRALIVEIGDGNATQRSIFYGTKEEPGANLVVDDGLVNAVEGNVSDCLGSLGTCILNVVNKSREVVQESHQKCNNGGRSWNNWAVSSLKKGRIASNVDDTFIDAFNMLMLTLPGTPMALYGDELGMKNGADTDLKALTVMQWNGDATAGFTDAANAKYPINADTKTVNVQFQTALGKEDSHLNAFKTLVKLRSQNSFLYGEFELMTNDEKLFTFVRNAKGHPAYFVAINFGNEAATVPGKGFKSSVEVPDECLVVATTPGVHSELAVETVVDLKKTHFLLQPGNGVVVKLGRQ